LVKTVAEFGRILTVSHMNDASERYARQMEAARVAVGRGDRAAAVEVLKAAVATTRGNPALHKEHTAALVRLGALEQELGRPAEAERVLTEAVAVGERNLGADHPSLGPALNELSRLYVRLSDFSRAEPVLKRLLTIARAKGDKHPEVATAIAGLAVAKRGLGHHAAAEVLFWHALRIREEVLAPDHMAIVVTLEQLGETCVTRGNFPEALVHLQRALLKRERALGVDHATVRTLGARIADLERLVLKPDEGTADSATPPSTPAHEAASTPAAPAVLVEASAPDDSSSAHPDADWRATPARPRFFASTATQPQPQRSGELKFLYQPVSAAPQPARPSGGRVLSPSHSIAATSALSDTALPATQVPSATLTLTAPSTPAAAPAPLAAAAIGPAATIATAPLDLTPSRDITDLWSSMKRATRYASAGAAMIALAIAAPAPEFDPSAVDEGDRAPRPSRVQPRHTVVALASAEAPRATISASVSATRASESRTAAAPTSSQPTRVNDAPVAAPDAPVAVQSLRRLVVPKVAMPSLDSMMNPGEIGARTAGTESIAVGNSPLATARNEDAAGTRPVLVFAPALRFPDELRAKPIDGEVVVQFRVTEKGRVDASTMQVVQSGHELFTLAVRNVLPRFRFEPARSAAPESKPQAAWVQFRAQFNARN
jgi:TonB family protein